MREVLVYGVAVVVGVVLAVAGVGNYPLVGVGLLIGGVLGLVAQLDLGGQTLDL